MITDTQRMKWLAARVDYMEHTEVDGSKSPKARGQYWPQSESDPSEAFIEGLCDLTLTEYVDAMITKELVARVNESAAAARLHRALDRTAL